MNNNKTTNTKFIDIAVNNKRDGYIILAKTINQTTLHDNSTIPPNTTIRIHAPHAMFITDDTGTQYNNQKPVQIDHNNLKFIKYIKIN